MSLAPPLADLAEIIAESATAAPADLARASLERRFDRKFLVPARHVGEALRSVGGDYRVVLAGEARLAHYDTLYFDTPTLRLYHDHRRRRAPRCKVRIRAYRDRDLSVLELKEKTARGDTRKRRWTRPDGEAALTPRDRAHLAEADAGLFTEGELVPVARTEFFRLTLVSPRTVERATLDFDVTLELRGRRRTLANFAIVEVKDAGRGQTSPLVAAVRRIGGKAVAFSKYCAAVALLGGERANTFRPALRAFDGTP
jgi:hypothetical protein